MATASMISKALMKIPKRAFWSGNIRKNAKFGDYEVVKPGRVSSMLPVPDSVPKPEYYRTGIPQSGPEVPEIKTREQIDGMRRSCRLAANILKQVGDIIKVGMTTDQIDRFVHQSAVENNAYPSPLNYKNYPKSVCTSVNNVACHGIPDDRPLRDGDILNVDITVFYNGYHGDCSKNFAVGNVDDLGRQLIAACDLCLEEAIALCKPNESIHIIGSHIEEKAAQLGFNIVPCFLGHGIGSYFHGAPDIYHFANSLQFPMQAGMTFTIEPVLTQGTDTVNILADNWTAVTTDDARTAQSEHTVLITETGCEILTLPD